MRNRALQRLDILDALVVAIDRREDLLDLVAAASSADEARDQLGPAFGFNEVQAVAVLDLNVRRFATEERRRTINDRNRLRKSIGLV